MSALGWLLLVADLACAGGAPAWAANRAPQPFGARPPCVLDVPAESTAQAQLAYAIDCRARAWRADADERSDLRRWAVLAFRAVRARFPAQREVAAEAAFRAGELLRADGHDGLAALEFDAAVDLGEACEFRSRARIELGHLSRRAGRWPEALQAFESVVCDAAAPARWRDEAALNVGRAHAGLDRIDDARRWLRRAAELGEDPLLCVRAYDAWAATYADAGDLEAAAGVVALAREALGAIAVEATELGRRVRAALERMSVIARLEEEVARRRRTERRRRGSGTPARGRIPANGRSPSRGRFAITGAPRRPTARTQDITTSTSGPRSSWEPGRSIRAQQPMP